jgi:two-component system, NarL family, invasion response regulator UvrY
MQKRILVGDDHPIIRKGLRALLDYYFKSIEVREACSCAEIMRELSHSRFSHLLLDIVLSDGTILEILPNIVRLYPEARMLIFSMQPATIYKRILQQYGIYYYISKNLGEDAIAVQLGRFLNDVVPPPEDAFPSIPDTPFSLLTARELEILHYILKGMGSSEIGSILNIRYNTVSTVRGNIFEKSHTGNITELFELASRYNVS